MSLETYQECFCEVRKKGPNPYYALKFREYIRCTFPKLHTHHDAVSRTALEDQRKHYPHIHYRPNNQTLSKESSHVDLCPMLYFNQQSSFSQNTRFVRSTRLNRLNTTVVYTSAFPAITVTSQTSLLPGKYEVLILLQPLQLL